MSVSNLSSIAIARHFDDAAESYDEYASIQTEVAQHLVDWAAFPISPENILDLGSGTGLVTEAIARRWPRAHVTALDQAPAMLREAQKKIPNLSVITGDASRIDLTNRFDAIFSSMMAHWLFSPRESMQRWQKWLKPEGRLFVALMVQGSFYEWRDLCSSANLRDGLWKMPPLNVAEGLATRTERHAISVAYSCASDFLHHLKVTGAATPRQGHAPFNTSVMRHLLRRASKPFVVTYDTLYIELPSSPSV